MAKKTTTQPPGIMETDDMEDIDMNTHETTTPVKIRMDFDAFFYWLGELQNIPNPSELCDPPDFLIKSSDDVNASYEIAAYLNTDAGTLIAHFYPDERVVDVTILNLKPGLHYMHIVRLLLDEKRKAA